MEKYIFILGRNWRLALAEIDIYLQQDRYKGQIVDYSATAAIIEFESSIYEDPQKALDRISELMIRLGSVQKIGKFHDFVEKEVIENAFPRDEDIENQRAMVYAGRRYVDNTLKDIIFELFPTIKNGKFFVATSIYPQLFNDAYYRDVLIAYFLHYVNKFFNTYLKEEGAKQAIYYKYPQENIEKKTLNPLFPHHFLRYRLFEPNRVEMLYCFTEKGMYIGRTLTVVDSNFQKTLDEQRPYKQFQQTIPPKFAKTLISFLNLPFPTDSKKIFDPFCGSGTIQQFGFLLDYQVYGTDISVEQVEGARKNLEFTVKLLEQNLSKKKISSWIIQSDINQIQEHFQENYFDGIATEPVLLPFYREAPDSRTVNQMIQNETLPLYKELFKQAFCVLKPGARIALVAPIILTKERQRIGLPLQEIAEEAGFKIIQLLDSTRIEEKEDAQFKLQAGGTKSIFDSGSKHLSREFFLFVKPKHK